MGRGLKTLFQNKKVLDKPENIWYNKYRKKEREDKKMTEEMRREMMEAMRTMRRVCEHSESCVGCPFDRYCDESVTPDRYEVEED